MKNLDLNNTFKKSDFEDSIINFRREEFLNNNFSIEDEYKVNFLKNVEVFLENINFKNFKEINNDIIIFISNINKDFPFYNEELILNNFIFLLLSLFFFNNEINKNELINLIQILSKIIPNFLSNDSINLILNNFLDFFNNNNSKLILNLLGLCINNSKESANKLFSLFNLLINLIDLNDLNNNEEILYCIRSFTKLLSSSGIFDLTNLFIFLIQFLKLTSFNEFDSPKVKIYSIWSFYDIVSQNPPGTAIALRDTQIFIFISNLLNEFNFQILIPTIRSISFLFQNLKSTIFMADININRLISLLNNGINTISSDSAICIRNIILSDSFLYEDFDFFYLINKSIELLPGNDFTETLSYITLLNVLVEKGLLKDFENINLTIFFKKLIILLENNNPSISIEVINIFYLYYEKISLTKQITTFHFLFYNENIEKFLIDLIEDENEELNNLIYLFYLLMKNNGFEFLNLHY